MSHRPRARTRAKGTKKLAEGSHRRKKMGLLQHVASCWAGQACCCHRPRPTQAAGLVGRQGGRSTDGREQRNAMYHRAGRALAHASQSSGA
eukprot:14938165-Alexandrium_andersonii.AAC.1